MSSTFDLYRRSVANARLKFLFDTNIIISAEPVNQGDVEAQTANVAKLVGLIGQLGSTSYIHPVSLAEISGDTSRERRDIRRLLLSKYLGLESPPLLQKR